jgi:hypothetical protein
MASVLIVVLDTSNRVYCIATLIVCTVQCSAMVCSAAVDMRRSKLEIDGVVGHEASSSRRWRSGRRPRRGKEGMGTLVGS